MIKDNSRSCAYDSFGNELFTGDYVSCVFLKVLGSWRNKYRAVLVKGKVINWTTKRIDIVIKEIANNTDTVENLTELIGADIGDTVRVKPDKICKLG